MDDIMSWTNDRTDIVVICRKYRQLQEKILTLDLAQSVEFPYSVVVNVENAEITNQNIKGNEGKQ